MSNTYPPQNCVGKNNLKKILLIIPYFGKFNNYFDLFLKSCEYNPTINWLIIGDNVDSYIFPTNVKAVKMEFDDLRNLIQSKFDFKISLPSPYKLCDFKPAYGFIFDDFTKEYDYWGHCDNDLIFGNIRHFLTENILQKNKVLSRGHLSLYKNTPFMNEFFQTHTNGTYKLVYSSPYNFAFDEWGPIGIANYFNNILETDDFYDEIPYEDIMYLSKHFIPAQKRTEKKRNRIYEFREGHIIKWFTSDSDNNSYLHHEEVLYVHFQKRPMKVETSNRSNFLMIPNKFVDSLHYMNLENVKLLGKDRIFYGHAIKIRYRNLLRKFNFSKERNRKKHLDRIISLMNQQ